MEAFFVDKYAQLLVDFLFTFQPESTKSKIIVYLVPEECEGIETALVRAIKASGLKAVNKKFMKEQVNDPTSYIEVVGDNVKKPLYSEELKKPQLFQKTQILLSPYPTLERARLAGLAYDEYVQDFISLNFLSSLHPIEAWKEKIQMVRQRLDTLNHLNIQKIRVISESIQFDLSLGKNRKWLGASGRNIPSFETFISPDWRTVNGTIGFNIPVNKYGLTFENIQFTFKEGSLTSFQSSNSSFFQKILNQKNMRRVGEFSLTDKYISSIQRFLASSIFDENMGGGFGNLHIALGKSYLKSYDSDDASINLEQLGDLGFNDAEDHIDFVNSEPKEVFATTKNGGEFLLYKDGEFK